MEQQRFIHVLDDVFYDWTILIYKNKTDVSCQENFRQFCITFQLKETPEPEPRNLNPAWFSTEEDWSRFLIKLYVDFPRHSSVLQFTIYFDVVGDFDSIRDDTILNTKNLNYSMRGVEYMDGKRIHRNDFKGAEIEGLHIAMDHLIKMYKPLSFNLAFFKTIDLYASIFGGMYYNMPAIAKNLFNQHREQIWEQRIKKHNECFYNKVRLCLPFHITDDVVEEIASYGYLTFNILDYLF